MDNASGGPLSTPEPENDVVYHCIPVAPEGDEIRPGTNYGSKIPESILQQFNAVADVKTPLIFAAMRKSKAVAYSFQFSIDEALMVMSVEIDGQEQELAFVSNRNETMSRERDATVYEIPRDGFLNLNDQQCMYNKPIPFSETKVAFRIKSVADIMRGGVQVFSFEQSYDELVESGLWKKFNDLFTKKERYKEIGNWVRDGTIFWENREQQVNALPGFAKMMGLEDMKSPKKSLKHVPK